MFKKIKKPLAVTSTMALVLTMSTSAFAMGPVAGGTGNSGIVQASHVQGERTQSSQRQNQGMQASQGQNGAVQLGTQGQGFNIGNPFAETQGMNGTQQGTNATQQAMNGMQQTMGMQGGFCGGMNTESVATAIAALSDDDAETLSDYISAYEEAVEAEAEALEDAEEGDDLSSYREAVQTTLQELLAAAKEAEIDLGIMMGNQNFQNTQNGQNNSGNQKTQEGQLMNGANRGMNTEAIATAIAALSDDDAETLSDYISAYEEAVEAESEALEDADEDTDLSDYREAVHTALQALLEAAEDEEINLGLMNGAGRGMNTDVIATAIAALSDDDEETLSDYISAYEEAVEAEAEALEDADEDTDLSDYREAVFTALRALFDAAKEADIEL